MSWLLYTSDREHGGTKILGIFQLEHEAWDYYYKTYDHDERYYNIPHIEGWENETRKV